MDEHERRLHDLQLAQAFLAEAERLIRKKQIFEDRVGADECIAYMRRAEEQVARLSAELAPGGRRAGGSS